MRSAGRGGALLSAALRRTAFPKTNLELSRLKAPQFVGGRFGTLLESYVPLLIFVLIVLGLIGALVTLSFVLGPSKPFRKKLAPYESGIIPDTPAQRRLSVRFYLTAMLFIIFDVEAVFFYPWAVLLRQLKWFGLIEMLVFMGILLIALAHIWRKGGLDWD